MSDKRKIHEYQCHYRVDPNTARYVLHKLFNTDIPGAKLAAGEFTMDRYHMALHLLRMGTGLQHVLASRFQCHTETFSKHAWGLTEKVSKLLPSVVVWPLDDEDTSVISLTDSDDDDPLPSDDESEDSSDDEEDEEDEEDSDDDDSDDDDAKPTDILDLNNADKDDLDLPEIEFMRIHDDSDDDDDLPPPLIRRRKCCSKNSPPAVVLTSSSDESDDDDYVVVEKESEDGFVLLDDNGKEIRDDDDEFFLSVDGVHCRINEPNDPNYRKNPVYYSHKFHQAGMVYEIALDLFKNQVAWVNGPFPASISDKKIFKEKGLMDKIPYGKKVIADHGYKGLDDYISRHSSLDSDAVRTLKKRALARQETFNKRLKDFGIVSNRFVGGVQKFKIGFEASVVLVQCSMECGAPLFDVLCEGCDPDYEE